ncbi:MAG: LexA family transcriptional regulator [Flavobacteriaceae bacterium]|nr:LexA family transcriptional regulator [Flavobacteriaceae bacterium]
MNYFSTNLQHLRNLKKLSQEQLAEELKWTRARIGSYEEGRSNPPIDIVIKVSEYFKIPLDILLKKDLRHTNDVSFIEIGNKRVLFPIMVNEDNEDMIEVVPVEASAGYLSGYDDPEYIEQLKKMNLPFLPAGKHRAFPIKGDSMLPVKPGSFIVGEFVENINDIKDGRTYIIVTRDEGMVYKRVYNRLKDLQGLLLYSDNSRLYPPYKVKAEDILELWEFRCNINTQEYSKEELQISSIISLFNELHIELQPLKEALGL